MGTKKNEPDRIIDAPSSDGIDRRGFLSCMAWAGAAMARSAIVRSSRCI